MTGHSLSFTRCRSLLAVVLLLVGVESSYAIPRFSLLTGTRCSVCHFDPQGSGIRTQLGWEMMNETGLFKLHGPDTSGTLPTNSWFDRKVIPGFDGRLQLVRVSTTGKETLIPMQLSTSLAYMPVQELAIYGDLNLASVIERIREKSSPTSGAGLYAGEEDYDLAVQFSPSISLPSIRVGMIQPSIGIRQDDHTPYIRREAALQKSDLLPPFYNDIGAEITYEGIRQLTVNVGIFNAYNLALANPEIGVVKSHFDFALPTFSARVMLWPQLLEQGINGEVGASILTNGSFRMINVFGGVGLSDKSTFYIEGLYGTNSQQRIIRNFSINGTYQFVPWLAGDWRYDWGQTELSPAINLAWAQAFTIGLEFFPTPYIELRPEYRLTQQNPLYGVGTYTGQWTAQIHLFY